MQLKFTKKNINNWIKTIFQVLFPLFLFWLIESVIWYFGGLVGIALHPLNWFFEPFTIDKQLPIVSWMLIFYIPASALWMLGPVFIYLLKGPKNYYKFLSVSIVVMLLTFIIYTVFPTYSMNLAAYGRQQLEQYQQSWNMFDKRIYSMLGNGSGYSALPSNHVSCTWLVTFGIIFCVDENKKPEFKPKVIPKWYKISAIVIKIFFVIYSILVGLSTFLLKQHFFVDWIGSILITFPIYFLFIDLSSTDFLHKPLIKFFNSLYFVSSFIDSDWKYYNEKEIYEWAKNSRSFIDQKVSKDGKWYMVKYFPHVLTIAITVAGLWIPWTLAIKHS